MAFKKYVITGAGVGVNYTLKKSRQKSIVLDIDNLVVTVNWSKETASDVERADGFTTLTPADLDATTQAKITELYDIIFNVVAVKEGFPSGNFQ